MERLYLKPSLCKAIAEYCEANTIEDINAFANRCAMQGLNIAKYGLSPGDNINRENKGIKDFKNEKGRKKKDPSPVTQGEEEASKAGTSRLEASRIREEKIEPTEETKNNITVRKIRIIKKDKND